MHKMLQLLLKSVAAGVGMTALVSAVIFGLSKAGASIVGGAFVLFGIPTALLAALFTPYSIERRFNSMIGNGDGDSFFPTLCLVGAVAQLLVICVVCSYRRFSRDPR